MSKNGKAGNVHVHADAAALGAALAARLIDEIMRRGSQGRRYILGCPGGRSPKTTYDALGKLANSRGADLSHLVIAMMDDYLVPGEKGLDHCDAQAHYSCRRFARVEIQGVFNAGLPPSRRVPDAQVWFPSPQDPESYDRQLEEAGGIDCFLLASGASDGHVAFNPPGSPEGGRSRVIELAEATRRDNLATFPAFKGIDEVPRHGVSVGLGTIASLSKSALMIVHGQGKREAARRLLAGQFDAAWPASVIHLCRKPELHLDQAAAAPEEKP